jgi:hypothetical protein
MREGYDRSAQCLALQTAQHGALKYNQKRSSFKNDAMHLEVAGTPMSG